MGTIVIPILSLCVPIVRAAYNSIVIVNARQICYCLAFYQTIVNRIILYKIPPPEWANAPDESGNYRNFGVKHL